MLHEECWLIRFVGCAPKQALYKSVTVMDLPTMPSAEAPAVKAAPKRRRGGKHRHKGSMTEGAGEAGVSGPEDASGAGAGAAEGTVADAALSDNLARLQLDRLASNAAAGGLMRLLLPPLLLILLLLRPCCCSCCCCCLKRILHRTSASY